MLQSGQPILEREELQVDEQGNERWFTATKTPLYNMRGDALGLIAVMRDITWKKESDRELLASRDQLAFVLTEMSDGLGPVRQRGANYLLQRAVSIDVSDHRQAPGPGRIPA